MNGVELVRPASMLVEPLTDTVAQLRRKLRLTFEAELRRMDKEGKMAKTSGEAKIDLMKKDWELLQRLVQVDRESFAVHDAHGRPAHRHVASLRAPSLRAARERERGRRSRAPPPRASLCTPVHGDKNPCAGARAERDARSFVLTIVGLELAGTIA